MTVHIGLNMIFVVPNATGGIETYARELVPELQKAAPAVRFTAFVSDARVSSLIGDTVPVVEIPVYPRRRFGWVPGEQTALPRHVERMGCDLLHSLASTCPLTGRFKRVTTIHDLIYRLLPREHSGIRYLGARWLVGRGLIPLAARRSERIITPSHAAARDLASTLRIPADKIDVCPHGPGALAGPRPTSATVLRARHDLGDLRIVFCSSPAWPHKNLLRLLDAWAMLSRTPPAVLVLAGGTTRYSSALAEKARAKGIASRIRLTGWLPPADLEGFYAEADCVVVPSLYEGFGMPVLEAMQRGAPVACSSTGALPEVAGAAALFFDPRRPVEIAAAVRSILADASLAERLRESGRRRAAEFTWRASARATLRSYEGALGRRLVGSEASDFPERRLR
jgi:glycosyltransferase involved in cell wall biosynthesis